MLIYTNEIKAAAKTLRCGEKAELTGVIYTSRDAAHKRLVAIIKEGGELPFSLEGATIYYAGPTGARHGMPIGSCGPTTSSRMDVYAPTLLDLGLGAMIGKGERNQAVKEAIVRGGAVYFCAIGGAGALACECIKSCEVIAFPELGCESVKRLTVEKFPVITAVDAFGGDIFAQGRSKWQK